MTELTRGMAASDDALRAAVTAVRRHRRRRLLLEGTAIVVAAGLLALLVGAVLRAVMGPGADTTLVVRAVGYLLIAGVAARFLVYPLLGHATDERLALYVEERAPHLRQSLLSAVHEVARPVAERASPALAARVIAQAVAAVTELERGAVLERPRARRAGGLLAAAGAVGLLLTIAGPDAFRDAGRLLFVPWTASASTPAFTISVQPGNVTVPRGAALDVRAELHGFVAAEAELVFRDDSSAAWLRLPMQRDSTGSGFVGRLFDVVRQTTYFVEADGLRSVEFAIAVVDLPAVSRLALQLRYPGYTGLAPEEIERGGDVAAVAGTMVRLRATVTLPVLGGTLRFDDGSTAPLVLDSAGRVVGEFKVTRDGFYRVDLTAPDGASVAGLVQYAITRLEDRAPTLRIETPGRDIKVTATEEVAIALRAADDFGVSRLELCYQVNGGEERCIPLADGKGGGAVDVRAVHTLFLEEIVLAPGDVIAYHAVARDGAGQSASSDIYFLEVRPYGLNYRAGEEAEGAGGQAAGQGGQSDTPDALSARQREIVAGTFNWIRDSAKTLPRNRRENLTTLAIAQGKLKDDVTALSERIASRELSADDTAFATVKAELDSSLRHMTDAEESLGLARTKAAIAAEQRALQHVQRAQAVFRDIEIRRGQQGGGGGGGGGAGQRPEDLADLFELETDKLRNQYEAVQQQRSNAVQQEVDEAAERLRQLAARQQQENERMQRQNEALRERLGRELGAGAAGGGSGQRELARQAEAEARRLERLARDRNSPELADAARRTQEAADAMNRAATGAGGQGNAALDRLRNAARDADGARQQGLSDGIRRLDDRARALEQQQEEIASAVNGLGAVAPTGRDEQLRRLDQRKDALGQSVEGLQAEAERLARDARRDQPKAAQRLEEAAATIRDGRLPDRVDYSKRVMRSGSAEYVRAFEQQIGEQIGAVREALSGAAGAVGEPDANRQQRLLDRTGDLVRELESLRERGAAARPGQPGQPGSGAQGEGRQGEGQGQGRGQGQGQGQGQEGQAGVRGGAGRGGGAGGSVDGGSPRQLGREVALRRQEAEAIRDEVAAQGGDVAELDRAIADLRTLSEQIARETPQGVAELRSAVIEGLKSFEFTLWRRLNGGDGSPAIGARGRIPPEYRALVEEYYRSLARKP